MQIEEATSFKDCIDFYYDRLQSKNNEYCIVEPKISNTPIPTASNLLHYEGLSNKMIDLDQYHNRMVVNEKAIKRFHPNEINNSEFWRYAKMKFPLFSVCGGDSKSIKDVNKKTLGYSKSTGLYQYLMELIKRSEEKLNVLEIGFGHGNIFNKINKLTNYIGLDFYKIKSLNRHKNLRIIDISGIPDDIPDNSLDVVYSVNVLQHCSQKDRFDYFKQAYKKLKPGGSFIGSCFIVTEQNSTSPVWGVVDENGRRYCHFFRQLTEVDTGDELQNLTRELTFYPLYTTITGVNHLAFIFLKSANALINI
jgi:SAM-dependent methyltransferase